MKYERARTRAALGFEPSDSDFVFSVFSRLSFLALGSTRNSSCLSGSGSTAASLGGSPSSSLSSSNSCCGLCGIGTSSCRDNLQKTVAPRRQGPWVPSPFTLVSLGPLPSCALMPPTLFREFLFSVAVGPLSLWVASPGVLSQPPASLGRFPGRRPFVRSTIAWWQEATDPQSPEGGSQRACTHGGAHSTASGRQALAIRTQLGMPARGPSRPHPRTVGSWVAALQHTNGGVVDADVPCGP